jgi:small-conductance mechanosensitive channel
MPDVGPAVAALQDALGELGQSQSSAAVAHAGAGVIEADAASAGFLGIAAGIALCGEQLKRIQQLQTDVGSAAKRIVEVVQRVNADMSPDDVVSTLSPAVRQLDAAAASTTAILIEVNAATVQANASLKGGKPQQMAYLLNDLDQRLTRALAKFEAAKARTEETIAEARQLGNFPAGVAA